MNKNFFLIFILLWSYQMTIAQDKRLNSDSIIVVDEYLYDNNQYKESVVKTYMDLADEASKKGNLSLSILYSMKAKKCLEAYGMQKGSIYIDNLFQLSSSYSMNNQNDSAIFYYQQTYDLMKETNNYHYADVLTLLAFRYIQYDNQKSINCLEQAIDEKSKEKYKNKDFYIPLSKDIVLLFGLYDKQKDVESEIRLAEKYFSLFDCSDESFFYIAHGLLKALFYENRCSQAISYGEDIIKCYKAKNNPPSSLWRIFAIMSQIYQEEGNLAKAFNYGMQAVKLIKSEKNKKAEERIQHLKWIAGFYSDFGEIETSIDYQNQALNITKDIFGENSEEVSLGIHNLAFYYSKNKEYKKAIELYEIAANKYKDLLGDDNPSYLTSLKNMAGNLSKIGEYGKALDAFEHIFSVEEKIYGASSPQIAITFAEIGEIYGKMRDSIHELESKKAAYKMLLELGAIAPLDPHFIKRGLARAYYKNKEYANCAEILCKELKNSREDLIEEMIKLPNQTRERLWYRDRQMFIQDLPRLAYSTMSDSLISIMYDYSTLFGKGLILNTNRSISQIAVESDSITKERYDNLKKIRDLRKSELNKDKNKRQNDIEDLNIEIKTVESSLISATHDFNKIREMVTVSWKDVQKHLDNGDLAIEFFSVQYPDEQSDSVVYMALTLKNDYSAPKLFRLFNLNELPKWEIDNENRLYDLIWKPIESELNGINKVYFSTWYSLNTIPIENLRSAKGIYMSDVYEMYRVSSTRELVLKHNDKGIGRKIHNMAIYGGLDFENTSQEQTNKLELSDNQLPSLYRGMMEFENDRGGADYLPYSLTEAERIAEEADRHHVNSILFSGVNGTEESFKRLSDSDFDIIHIATHGMCLNVNEADSSATNHNYRFLAHYLNSNPLNRSFLFMSGGNKLARRDSIPDNCEDGILTANEISKMYLDNVELVVLSTCQSGLGEQSSEGVMGLQQGFKKAGVKSILMTLDTVDDKATQILMVEFYKNLMSGKSKHQSLKDAQKYLREFDKGKYDKPEYWASFIMLDGLN